MKEKKVKRRFTEELHKEANSKVVEFEKPINDGDLGYGRADAFIPEDDVVIEFKATDGEMRKGIGQCASYKTAGFHTALVVPMEEIAVELIKICEYNNIGLIGVEPLEGYEKFVKMGGVDWVLSDESQLSRYEKWGSRSYPTNKVIVGVESSSSKRPWRGEL